MDIKKQADRPGRMSINLEAIPQELKDRPQWVFWKWEQRDGRWTKPPYSIEGKPASSTDPATWASFQAVATMYRNGKGWDGIGYMIAQDDPYTGIDLDGAYDKDAKRLRDWARHIVILLNSYCEISPSGGGVKMLLKGKLPRGGHHGEKLGVFDQARYFAITGQTINLLNKIEERQAELDTLIRQEWPQDFETPGPLFETHEVPQGPPTLTKEDFDIYDKAGNAKNGEKFMKLWNGEWSGEYPSQSEADAALCSLLSFWTQDTAQIDRLFRASKQYREKWERADYREKTITHALKNRQETYKQPQTIGKASSRTNLDALEGLYTMEEDYLWKRHIPSGQPVMVNGREGIGKTSICLVIAREILLEHPRGEILWLATEGQILDTKNKMKTFGLSDRFYVARKSDGTFKYDFTRFGDLTEIDGLLSQAVEPTLAVFIDSIRGMSRFGDNDSEIGQIMHKLNALICEKYRASLVYIDHFKKGKTDNDNLLDKAVGTTAKTAAVRVILSVEKESAFVRAIRAAKSNLGGIPELRAYQVQGDIKIVQPSQESEEAVATKVEEFLLGLFATERKIPARDVFDRAERAGLNVETLKKTKTKLGIRSVQEKLGDAWVWISPF